MGRWAWFRSLHWQFYATSELKPAMRFAFYAAGDLFHGSSIRLSPVRLQKFAKLGVGFSAAPAIWISTPAQDNTADCLPHDMHIRSRVVSMHGKAKSQGFWALLTFSARSCEYHERLQHQAATRATMLLAAVHSPPIPHTCSVRHLSQGSRAQNFLIFRYIAGVEEMYFADSLLVDKEGRPYAAGRLKFANPENMLLGMVELRGP